MIGGPPPQHPNQLCAVINQTSQTTAPTNDELSWNWREKIEAPEEEVRHPAVGQPGLELGEQVEERFDRRLTLPARRAVDGSVESEQRRRADEVRTETVELWFDCD